MSQQASISRTMARGYPGQLVGSGHKTRSMVNDKGAARAVYEITVDTVTDSATYTFTIGGFTVSYVADASATAREIVTGLIAAARANQSIMDLLAGINPNGNTKIRITAKTPGTDVTVAESDSKLSLATITANVAVEPIPFGFAVVQGTAGDRSCMLPTTTGQKFKGIVQRIHSNTDPLGLYPATKAGPQQDVSVTYEGTILAIAEQAVAPGDPVYFRHTASGALVPGGLRKDADTANADLIAGAVWDTTAAAGEVAEVVLNNP